MLLDYQVFIPAKDAGKTLATTLRSLRAQALPPQSVTVLDDGSGDDTVEVARRHGVGVVTVAGGAGLAAAQNAALPHITCALVAFLDADDAWTRHAGETLTRVLTEDPELAAVAGRAVLFDETESPESVLARCAASTPHLGPVTRVQLEDLWDRNQATKSATLFRSAALLAVGGYRVLPSAEDYDLLLRLYAAGRPVATVQDVTCWRLQAASSMTANSGRMLQGEILALEHFHDTPARREVLPRAGLRRRRLVAWKRAVARDVQYHASTAKAPDPPICSPWGALVGRAVRATPAPVTRGIVRLRSPLSETKAVADPSPARLHPCKEHGDNSAPRCFIEPGGFSSLNVGDELMLVTTLTRLYARWPGACVTVNTIDTEALHQAHAGLHTSAPMGARAWSMHNYLPPSLAGMALVWRIVRRRAPGFATAASDVASRVRRGPRGSATRYLDAVRGAHLVVLAGQGAMTDAFAPRASELLETLRLGADAGATTAVLGQGIGPISGAALTSQFRNVMTRVDMIALREGAFAPTLLAHAGVDPQRVVVTGDDTIEAAYDLRAGQLGKDIGINVRVADYSGVARDQAQTIVATAADLAAQHGSSLRQVVISRHEDEHDSQFMASAVLDAEGGAFQSCMGAITRCRVCIVGSYHAAVFSLSVGVPVVAIVGSRYYEQKFGGLAGQFDGGILLVRAGRPSSADDVRAAAEHLWNRAPALQPVLLSQARRQIAASSAAYEKLFDLVDERRSTWGS